MSIKSKKAEALEQAAQLKESVSYIAINEAKMTGKEVSPEFIQSLTNAVNSYIDTMAKDLEDFAVYHRRDVIEPKDVVNCASRNDSLHQIISDIANTSSSNE